MHGAPHIVSDVMTHTVAAVGRRATFKEIVRLMRDRTVSALPLIEGGGRVVGVVSEADLLPKEEFRDSAPDRYTQLRRLSDLTKAGEGDRRGTHDLPRPHRAPGRHARPSGPHPGPGQGQATPGCRRRGMLEGVVARADLLKVFLRTDEEITEEVGREIVSYLFPPPGSSVHVEVRDGVVKLVGRVRDTSLMPAAARLVRADEGVVDVRFDLTRPDESAGAAEASADGTGRIAPA